MGVWRYNGSSWSQITTVNADVLAIASDTNAIVGDFAGYGVYSYNGSGMNWTQLTRPVPRCWHTAATARWSATSTVMASTSITAGWTQINSVNATELAISAVTNTVFGSFPGYGVYDYTQNTWTQLSPNLTPLLGNGSVPTVITATPGGSGVSEWNGVSWTPLS